MMDESGNVVFRCNFAIFLHVHRLGFHCIWTNMHQPHANKMLVTNYSKNVGKRGQPQRYVVPSLFLDFVKYMEYVQLGKIDDPLDRN
jgi:hypothetical protein